MEVSIKLDIRKKEARALLEYLHKLHFVEVKAKATAADILNLSKQVNKALNKRLDEIYNNNNL